MKTTGEEIKGRIDSLPSDYKACVHMGTGGHAEVESFSDADVVYKVSIQRGEGDELEVICSCAATSLCKHIVSFYAVAKEIEPIRSTEDPLKPPQEDVARLGAALIAEAIEKLVDGITLIVKERIKEE